MFRVLPLLFFAFVLLQGLPLRAETDNTKFVILGYGTMADEGTLDIFNRHIDYFRNANPEELKIYSLEKALVSVIDAQRPTAPVSLVITIEDTSLHFLKNTLPQILKKNIPITLGITPSRIDRLENDERTETWRVLRSLAANPAINFALTSYDYTTLPALPYNEIKRQIISTKARFNEMMGFHAVYFLYPYGAYNKEIELLLKEQNFLAAIGTHSGVVSALTNKYALPQFTITARYEDVTHLQTIIEALPFPATEIQPSSTFLNENPPVIGFTVPESWMDRLSNLKCYGQEMGEVSITPLGKNRLELRFTQPFEPLRTRINCTWPVVDSEKKTRWRWLGFLFVKNAPPVATETTEQPIGQPALLP